MSLPGTDVAVTVSVGVAGYPEHASTPDRLARLADAALYLAKRQGRNRVELAEPSVVVGAFDAPADPGSPASCPGVPAAPTAATAPAADPAPGAGPRRRPGPRPRPGGNGQASAGNGQGAAGSGQGDGRERARNRGNA